MEPDCTYRLCGLRTAEQYTEAFETDSEAQKSIEKESASSSAPSSTRGNPVPDKHPSTLSEISVKDLPAFVKGEEDLVYIPQSQDRESGKYEIRDTTGELDFDGALDEVVADGCEMMLKRSSVVSTLARENPSLFDRIHDWLKEWAAKIRKAFSGVEAYHEEAKAMLDYMDQLQKIWDKALTEAARNAADVGTETKTAADNGGRVQYQNRDSYDPETATIKKQIDNSLNLLNSMDPVGEKDVPYFKKGEKDKAALWAITELKKKGYQVDKQGYGTIYFDKNDIDQAIRYADTAAEKGAMIFLPDVLKRGIEIGRHDNHDNRGKRTITFGAPVVMNGIRANMAVVVNMRSNHFYAERIVLPDGSAFVLPEKTNTPQDLPRGVVHKDSLAKATSGGSANSIRASSEKSNRKNSERDREYMEAVNSGNTAKAQRMVDEAARQAGYTKLFYHGSKKGGGFTVFKDWQYFTENKDYAKRYTQRDNPGSLYTVYAKMEHPFDTRDAEAAEIFANARQELGLGEIQEIASLIVDSW